MLHKVYKLGNREITQERFDSIEELLKTCDGRTPHDWAEDNGSRNRRDRHFTGVKDYDEARELLEHGWAEKVDEIQKGIEKFTKDEEAKRTKVDSGVSGFAPIVPNYLAGLPNSMLVMHPDTKKVKVIKILVDLSVACSESPENVIRKGIKLMSKVNSLEKCGYRVRIDTANSFCGSENTYICNVLLKSENQPLDIKRIAFPLFHSAMFRCIMFDWYERIPEAKYIHAYGHPIYADGEKDKIIKMLYNEPNEIAIDYETDLNTAFKPFK
jgi:hypothetical protein